ncbi:hypothetical protein MCEKE4_00731 [Acidimicrobiia bacterium]
MPLYVELKYGIIRNFAHGSFADHPRHLEL